MKQWRSHQYESMNQVNNYAFITEYLHGIYLSVYGRELQSYKSQTIKTSPYKWKKNLSTCMYLQHTNEQKRIQTYHGEKKKIHAVFSIRLIIILEICVDSEPAGKEKHDEIPGKRC